MMRSAAKIAKQIAMVVMAARRESTSPSVQLRLFTMRQRNGFALAPRDVEQ
jgi:hypothetical protein